MTESKAEKDSRDWYDILRFVLLQLGIHTSLLFLIPVEKSGAVLVCSHLFVRCVATDPACDVFKTCDVNGRRFVVCVLKSAGIVRLLEYAVQDGSNLVSTVSLGGEISGVMAVPIKVSVTVAHLLSVSTSIHPYVLLCSNTISSHSDILLSLLSFFCPILIFFSPILTFFCPIINWYNR